MICCKLDRWAATRRRRSWSFTTSSPPLRTARQSISRAHKTCGSACTTTEPASVTSPTFKRCPGVRPWMKFSQCVAHPTPKTCTSNPGYEEPLDTTNLRNGHHPDEFKWNRALHNESLDTTNHLLGYKRVPCIEGLLYSVTCHLQVNFDSTNALGVPRTVLCIEDSLYPGSPDRTQRYWENKNRFLFPIRQGLL